MPESDFFTAGSAAASFLSAAHDRLHTKAKAAKGNRLFVFSMDNLLE
jgi:hypothetical protein